MSIKHELDDEGNTGELRPEDHDEKVHRNVDEDFQDPQLQGASNGRNLYRLPIYDNTTMKPLPTTSPRSQRASVKPTDSYHGQPVDTASNIPSLLDIDTQRFSRRSNAHSRKNFEFPSKTRHLSPQRTYQGQARESFHSVERSENLNKNNNNNNTTLRKQNRNHQRYPLPRNNSDHKQNPNSLTGNDFRKHEFVMPTAKDVFDFMVKNMEGKGTPDDIRNKSDIFPAKADISQWFRNDKSGLFTLIEKNGDISYMFVYYKKVTYCTYYCNTKQPCRKTGCQRYHICRNLCSGECKFGPGCDFSHDCFDEHNKKISDALGFSNTFSSDEICIILRLSFPHVCSTWSFTGTCTNSNCADLHLCPGYIFGKCKNGPTCPNIHDRNTDHNRAILQAFKMTEMRDVDFKWQVFIVYNPDWTRNAFVSEEADDAGENFICIDNILEECRDRQCKFIHSKSRLPYVWQINISDKWISLNESEEIEKSFADNEKSSTLVHTKCKEINLSIKVFFEPAIKAIMIVQSCDKDVEEIKVRRLSTKSYIGPVSLSCDKKVRNNDKFFTQWRWYWLDDDRQWKLYQPDALQHTLEVKFLAKQKDFHFWRKNYRLQYVIDFEDMGQRNIDTHKVREISRRPIFVSQENVQEKQFPVCLSAAPLVETPLPDKWVPWDLAHPFELVSIEKDSEIYTWVSDCFFKTLSRTELKIDTIFRMQNHKLWALYCNQKNSMLANLKRLGKEEHVDQRYLFHGTDKLDAVCGISINNLDIRVSGKNATRYGDGAYFARDAKYSHNFTGTGPERFMFMVTVLVGDYTLGEKQYRRPPNKPGSDHELFDSCVNKLDNPSKFIVFDKNQYYPEYLIQYHKMHEDAMEKTIKHADVYGYWSSSSKTVITDRHGTVGGMNVSTTHPATNATASGTQSNDPTPLVYPQRSSSSRMSVSPPRVRSSRPTRITRFRTSDLTSDGPSSVRYVSHAGSYQAACRPDPGSQQ